MLFSRTTSTAEAKAKALGTTLQAPPPVPPGASRASWPFGTVEAEVSAETSDPQLQYEYEQAQYPSDTYILKA